MIPPSMLPLPPVRPPMAPTSTALRTSTPPHLAPGHVRRPLHTPPTARDIARAAGEFGVSYTLVTGIPAPEQFIDNVLTSPQSVLCSAKFERFEAVFSGAGDTLSATFAALLASGCDLSEAFSESLSYLDRCLDGGFRPGMGNVLPDRLFWAQPEDDADDASEGPASSFEFPPHDTQH